MNQNINKALLHELFAESKLSAGQCKRTPLVVVDTPIDRSFFYKEKDSNIIYFERENKKLNKRKVIDVFGDFWSIATAKNLPPKKVFIKSGNDWIEVRSNNVLVVPPFATIEWQIEDCDFKWNAILVQGEYPDFLPSSASLFTTENFELSLSYSELLKSVHTLKFQNNVERFKSVCEPIKIAKKIINSKSSNKESIFDIANAVHLAPAHFSRLFKQSCGLSPIQYRNKMRIYNSMIFLLKGQRVSRVGLDVGFNDLARFNKQFKKILEVVPSDFIP